MKNVLVGIAVLIALISMPTAHAQDTPEELSARMHYWSQHLPFCPFPAPFPAKDQDNGIPPSCNDGDSVSLNGLTCASGDDRGCIAVRDSQGSDGQFWRSPKKRYEAEHHTATSTEKPSSNDSAQGAWAYIAEKRDVYEFRQWTSWMKGHKEAGIWPRYCLDQKCDFNVSDCPMLDRLAVYLKEGNSLCDFHPDISAESSVAALQSSFDATARIINGLPGASAFRSSIDPLENAVGEALAEARRAAGKADDVREKVETLARVSAHAADFIAFVDAYVNKAGAARQDVAYSVYLLEKYGGFTTVDAAQAADVIASKENENAFFEYVAHGPTQKMLSQILKKCPSESSDKLHLRVQWIWEREDRETDPSKPQPWEQTMYWDCLFVGKLYQSGPIKGYNFPGLPGYGDLSKESEEQLQKAIVVTKELLENLDKLRRMLTDPRHPPTPTEVINLLKDVHNRIAEALPGPAAQIDRQITSLLPSSSVPTAAQPLTKPIDKAKEEIKKKTGFSPPSPSKPF